MGEKIAKLGIKRANDMMYYIKAGDVWAAPRKKPGLPKERATKVAATGIEMDYSKYLYYLDGDGDVARKDRRGDGRHKKTAKISATRKAAGRKTKTKKATAMQKASSKKAKGRPARVGPYLSGRGGFGSAQCRLS